MSDNPSKDGLVELVEKLYYGATGEPIKAHVLHQWSDAITTHTEEAVAVAVEGCAEIAKEEIDIALEGAGIKSGLASVVAAAIREDLSPNPNWRKEIEREARNGGIEDSAQAIENACGPLKGKTFNTETGDESEVQTFYDPAIRMAKVVRKLLADDALEKKP